MLGAIHNAPVSIRRRLLVHGRVQGVFYRDSARACARAEGVAGWARNLSDGTVEVVLEGNREAVARAERFCRMGPAGARVDSIDARDEAPAGLQEFEIR